jgi:hypothetical protein
MVVPFLVFIPVSRLINNTGYLAPAAQEQHPRRSSIPFPVFSFIGKELGDKGMGQEQTQLSLTKLVLVCSVACVG